MNTRGLWPLVVAALVIARVAALEQAVGRRTLGGP